MSYFSTIIKYGFTTANVALLNKLGFEPTTFKEPKQGAKEAYQYTLLALKYGNINSDLNDLNAIEPKLSIDYHNTKIEILFPPVIQINIPKSLQADPSKNNEDKTTDCITLNIDGNAYRIRSQTRQRNLMLAINSRITRTLNL